MRDVRPVMNDLPNDSLRCAAKKREKNREEIMHKKWSGESAKAEVVLDLMSAEEDKECRWPR